MNLAPTTSTVPGPASGPSPTRSNTAAIQTTNAGVKNPVPGMIRFVAAIGALGAVLV